MGGEHLAVGVDVDALALGLVEEFLEVAEVVPGDEDGLAFDGGDADPGGLGMAEGAGVGGVEQLHYAQVDGAGLQVPGEEVVDGGILVGEEVQGGVNVGVDLFVFLTEPIGVMGVGGEALESVGEQLLQPGDVGSEAVETLLDGDHAGIGLGEGDVGLMDVLGGAGHGDDRFAGSAGGLLVEGPGAVVDGAGGGEQGVDLAGVEVDVGHGGEQGVKDEAVDVAVSGAELAGRVGVLRDADGGVEEEVLEFGGGFILAADTGGGAGLARTGLFALVAVHVISPWLVLGGW